MQDAEMGDFEHNDTPINEADVERMQQANSPRRMGVMLTVFVAVLVLMIGSLASYYYYNVQKQGSGQTQTISDNWDEIVLATTNLTTDFTKVTDYKALFDDNTGSFSKTVGSSNKSLKDVSYNLQSISGYAFSGNLVISRMTALVESYVDYLRELQSILDRGKNSLIADIAELDNLDKLNQDLRDNYDKLLIADKTKVISSILPEDIFKMPDSITGFVQKYLDDKKAQGVLDDAEKAVVQGVVNKFMQAYTAKDPDSMMMYLTDQAKAEFNKGIVEEATDIQSFSITDTRKIDANRMEIDVTIKKQTPTQTIQTEKRKFVLLQKDGKWLIDSWKIV